MRITIDKVKFINAINIVNKATSKIKLQFMQITSSILSRLLIA